MTEYEGVPLNFKLPKERFLQAQFDGACRNCGRWITPFKAEQFVIDEGFGFYWHVTPGNSQACEKCYSEIPRSGAWAKYAGVVVAAYTEHYKARDDMPCERVILEYVDGKDEIFGRKVLSGT